MKDLINYIAQALVDHPEEVSVQRLRGIKRRSSN